MRILLFGGTTEGRLLAEGLAQAGHAVTVSVATPLGAESLGDFPAGRVLTGRLDQRAMAALLPGYDLCIDATHPYAVEVTKNLRQVCGELCLPLRRLLRPESPREGCVLVESPDQAAAYLKDEEGNILLTTGAKELGAFAGLEPSRLFPRILPTHESLAACEALGIPHRNILALQGPFTRKMNEAILEQYHIRWLVTKDGGRAGGYGEKQGAAQALGIPLVVVCRPPEEGSTLEELLAEFGKGERPCT